MQDRHPGQDVAAGGYTAERATVRQKFVAAMITDFAEDGCAAVGKERAPTPWRRAMFRAMQTSGRWMSSNVRLLGYLGLAPQIVRGPKSAISGHKRLSIYLFRKYRCPRLRAYSRVCGPGRSRVNQKIRFDFN
jgi:hypothetical protein